MSQVTWETAMLRNLEQAVFAFAGWKALNPVIWRLEWPDKIKKRVVSFSNLTGDISNSDLEMAGLLVQWIVIEHLVDMKFEHAGAWRDNTPTVSWATKLSSSKSMVTARLMQALACCL